MLDIPFHDYILLAIIIPKKAQTTQKANHSKPWQQTNRTPANPCKPLQTITNNC
jgi:hypothetical protein